jgi:hypothetical protein
MVFIPKQLCVVSIIVVAAAISSGARAAESTNKPSANPTTAGAPEVRGLMRSMLQKVINLVPLMMSDKEFQDSKNSEIILGALTDIRAALKQTEHKQIMRSPGLKISRETLETQLGETERIFRSGNKGFARWMLNSNLSLCISCHTQIPSVSNLHLEIGRGAFKSPYQEAEFYFLTRQFDGALSSYETVIKNYTKGNGEVELLERSLERVVAIFSRIRRDARGGVKELDRISGFGKYPDYIQSMINSWKQDFRSWSREGLPSIKKEDQKELRRFVERHLATAAGNQAGDEEPGTLVSDPKKAVSYLFVSGVLYEYLRVFNDTTLTPDILYWLAQCDRGLNNEFFYSLADLYLKECMSAHSKSPVAKKCFNEYERGIRFSFTGSAGTDIPEDVRAEIERYRTLVMGPAPTSAPKSKE